MEKVRRQAHSLRHPAREPLGKLEEALLVMGSPVFSAQYQQAPVPAEGALVKRAWLRHYWQLSEGRSGDQIVQRWDTGSKTGALNDWSFCITALRRGREIYVIDVFRDRLGFPSCAARSSSSHGASMPTRSRWRTPRAGRS